MSFCLSENNQVMPLNELALLHIKASPCQWFPSHKKKCIVKVICLLFNAKVGIVHLITNMWHDLKKVA